MVRKLIFVFSLALGLGLLTNFGLIGWPRPAQAAGITVNSTSDTIASDGVCTLREAIQAANTDAVVNECTAGSGYDFITFVPGLANQIITLAGTELSPTTNMAIDGSAAPNLTISGNNASRVFNITSDEVTLINLTVVNGKTSGYGGGIYASRALTLTNVNIVSNTVGAGNGGGIYVYGPITLIGGQFISNTSGVGGGLYANDTLIMSGTQFIRNRARTSGGGLYIRGAAVLTRGQFISNIANSEGGGVYARSELVLNETQFFSNVATSMYGGGVAAHGGSTKVIDSLFYNNSSGGYGGGLDAANNTLTISATQFLSNTARIGGGGLSHVDGDIGGVENNNVSLTNVLLARNNSEVGAAIYLGSSDNVGILHTTIVGSSLISSSAIFIHHAYNLGTLRITNTIISSHTTGIRQNTGGLATEDYNLFFGNTENLSGTITSGGHSLTGNPAFENPASDDYHLTTTSAAHNTGTNAGVTSDFEGAPRPQGGGFDIGFDEVTIQAAPLANDDTATTLEDIGLTITVLNNDNDPNGDPISLAAIGAARHGATAISGTTAIYTPALNFAGTDSFTYTASDGTLTGTARVTVTVTPSNDGPIVGTTKTLYQGVGSQTPDNQGFFYFPVGPASNTATAGVTTLDTSSNNTTQAGYNGTTPFVPTLDRATGYTVRFTAQVISENHTGSDRNGDGVEDRAGFSVIALSSDKRGIELGFWTNRIWAQNGGAPIDTGGALFTQGEGAVFDTTAGLIPYELRVLGGAYSLAVGSTEILSGSLRDYTAFTGSFDVYETPNFLFFGDDTTSARASVRLSHISVLTNATLPDRTIASGSELVVDKLGLLDVDAGGQTGVVTLTVNSGVITLTTNAPNGLTAGQISGNGTGMVVATGPLAQINNSLAFTPALIYRSNSGFLGGDSLTVTINDQGHTGGGALTGQKSFNINVQAAELGVTKTVNTLTPLAGQRVIYTLAVSNVGNLNVTGATLFDNLPASLTFAGPISLDPAGAGTIGTPPTIVTNLTVAAGQRITVTLPVTVNLNLNPGAQISNTATISSPMTEAAPANNSGTVIITLANPNNSAHSTYLPLIVKSD